MDSERTAKEERGFLGYLGNSPPFLSRWRSRWTPLLPGPQPQVSVLHLGGVYLRMEYIAVGEPLLEAFTAEHHASPGDVRSHRRVRAWRALLDRKWCWLEGMSASVKR